MRKVNHGASRSATWTELARRRADSDANARAGRPLSPRSAWALANLGFKSAGVSPDEVAHRFECGSVHVDVLGPDGLGGFTHAEIGEALDCSADTARTHILRARETFRRALKSEMEI